jgi:hypothetical protein
MTTLSPASQAILDAFDDAHDQRESRAACLAAALTAIAVRVQGADGIRQDLFDVINELNNL